MAFHWRSKRRSERGSNAMVNAFQCTRPTAFANSGYTYNLRCFPNVSVSSKFRIRRHFEADMGKLSVYARNRILSLRSSGVKIQKIKDMLEEEGIETSRSSSKSFSFSLSEKWQCKRCSSQWKKAHLKRRTTAVCRRTDERERWIDIKWIKK